MARQLDSNIKRNAQRKEALTKTQRMLEENDMKETIKTPAKHTSAHAAKETVTVKATPKVAPAPEPAIPSIWMLSAADIQDSSPALAKLSDADLESTVEAVRAELLRNDAKIKDGVVTGIDPDQFNKICNSIITEMHKGAIMDHLEKNIRIDVVDILGSDLKEPELTALVDNVASKCFVQNVDVEDGGDYTAILDSYIDPVMDQLAATAAKVAAEEESTPLVPETAAAVIVTESATDDTPAVAIIAVEHTEVAPPEPAYKRQPIFDVNQPTQSTDVLRASNLGGQNVTLTAIVNGEELEVEAVRVRTVMQAYKPSFILSNVDGNNIAFAAVDEFYDYRSPIEKKQVVLGIIAEAGKQWYNESVGHFDDIYISMDGVNIREQLTDEEITCAVWGHSHGPYDRTQMNWSDIISVTPGVKSLRFSRNACANPPKHLTGVVHM